MMRLVLFSVCLSTYVYVGAQSSAFTILGGLTMGNQKWNDSGDQAMSFRYHGAVRVESYNPENDKSAVFAQVGYHVRGSRQRFRFLTQGGGIFNNSTTYEFRNASLILGAKSKRDFGLNNKYYYFGGIRGDYTINTNLSKLSQGNPFFTLIYPSDGFVRHWNAGLSVGAGLELKFRELVGAQVEFSVHPDLTLQYQQPAVGNVINPNDPGNSINVPARDIRNISFELSVGLRLIRKVIYVE